jgi:hypothetical protein
MFNCFFQKLAVLVNVDVAPTISNTMRIDWYKFISIKIWNIKGKQQSLDIQ